MTCLGEKLPVKLTGQSVLDMMPSDWEKRRFGQQRKSGVVKVPVGFTDDNMSRESEIRCHRTGQAY